MIISIIPINVYGNYMDLDFRDIKVGKTRSITEQLIMYSDNGFKLYDRDDKVSELSQISDNSIVISPNINGNLDILSPDNEVITTIPGDGSIIIGSADDYNSIVQLEKNKYRDYITFLIKQNTIEIINHIDIEHYLYGVVPKEIPANSHLEALKAQSLVARSFAYANINNHSKDGYNLCDTTHCQVYGAYDNEHPATNQAVIQTYGEYVTYDGKIISTPYHSSSGGYTEDSSKVWIQSLPYLVPVEDVFSNNSPNSTWSFKIPVEEVKSKLNNAGIYVGELLDLEILETSKANRVTSLKVVGSSSNSILKGDQLRTILGTTIMKSTWFNINKEGGKSNTRVYAIDGNGRSSVEIDLSKAIIIDGKNEKSVSRSVVSRAISNDRTSTIGSTFTTEATSFVFNGRGFGHGVGMSQYGAMEMAKQGYNYDDIIKHYYKGVNITNIGK